MSDQPTHDEIEAQILQLQDMAQRLREAREVELAVRTTFRDVVRDAHAAGVSKKTITRVTGLTPETVRQWLEWQSPVW